MAEEDHKYSYREIQQECKSRGIPAVGTLEMLKDKLITGLLKNEARNTGGNDDNLTVKTEDANSRKKQKVLPEGDFICPITKQLPVVPVVAEDGRIYEMSAIKHWISMTRNSPVKSPLTGAPMGIDLVRCFVFKSMVGSLVEEGFFKDELVTSWKERSQKWNDFEETKKKAHSGNVNAMLQVARAYENDTFGLINKDLAEAEKWYKMAADSNDIAATASYGEFILNFTDDKLKGVDMIKLAAISGHPKACRFLGMWYSVGDYNLPISYSDAKHYLRKGLSLIHANTVANAEIKNAQDKLKELENPGTIHVMHISE